MTGTLLRTKTSGPGKKVKQLIVYVPFEACVTGHPWLKDGYDLWKDAVCGSADYFIPRLAPGADCFEDKLASSMDVSGLNTYLLTLLSVRTTACTTPPFLEYGDDKLLDDGMEGAWAGHSERSSLPSLAAALGIPFGTYVD